VLSNSGVFPIIPGTVLPFENWGQWDLGLPNIFGVSHKRYFYSGGLDTWSSTLKTGRTQKDITQIFQRAIYFAREPRWGII